MAKINAFLSLLFLFAFTIEPKSVIGVQDTDGYPLKIVDKYYIMALLNGKESGGIISLQDSVVVVQHASNKNSTGLPITISTNETKVINDNTAVTIKFANNVSGNANSSTWIVVWDESSSMWYVAIGNADDRNASLTKTGSFQITKFLKGYKIVFCGASVCEDVGTYFGVDGNTRLGLIYGRTLVVKFKNADR